MANTEDHTKDCYVAVIDILGFSELVRNESHDVVLGKISQAVDDIDKPLIEYKFFQPIVETFFSGDTKIVRFSDTIVLYGSTDSTSLIQICDTASRVMQTLLDSDLSSKCAVAKGKFTVTDSNIFFGRPLIDAYELHNELKTIGLVLHHSAEADLCLGQPGFISCNTPFRWGSATHTQYDWSGSTTYFAELIHALMNESSATENEIQLWTNGIQDGVKALIKKLEAMRKSCSGPPRVYYDNAIYFLTHQILSQIKVKFNLIHLAKADELTDKE